MWYFVKLCKEAKAAKIGVSQVINLLRIANNYLPSECEKENSLLYDLRYQATKLQAFVNNYKNNDQEFIKLRKTIEKEILRIL